MKRIIFAVFITLALLGQASGQAQEKAPFTRTEDVIYARKFGTALTLDVFQPAKPNGAGLIAVMSGGWFSAHDTIQAASFAPYLDRGYFITSNLPPTLIIQGDADKLVPMQQAERFVKKAQAAGAQARLIVKEGQAHGWPDLGKDATKLADWFDEHLRGSKGK